MPSPRATKEDSLLTKKRSMPGASDDRSEDDIGAEQTNFSDHESLPGILDDDHGLTIRADNNWQMQNVMRDSQRFTPESAAKDCEEISPAVCMIVSKGAGMAPLATKGPESAKEYAEEAETPGLG
eukprot:CAMPEP_0184701298 /NCGR_PEP_ID=MMETSP0313-20130426/19219_1 /TAXON_ID=2792 /ORGANISM="Porphyridium aerugineum, Strain SAG 1380-2" /LENGTH=124 /DNA_ID=CAMNT_0027161311 /DNA_START=34 /DNA_END=404 /DNA_ORIENTATION=-